MEFRKKKKKKKKSLSFSQVCRFIYFKFQIRRFSECLLEAGACGTYSLANNCKGGINEIIQLKINEKFLDIENHKEFTKKSLKVLEQTHNKKKD